MTKLTADQFTQAVDGQGWSVSGSEARVVYRTGDFATGLKLVNEIGRHAEEANHHPDLLLTYPSVDVRLTTHSEGGLTEKDVDLARKISAVAAELGVAAD
jgi:4a-hydroxytetrahydrobiopterin dehydratase